MGKGSGRRKHSEQAEKSYRENKFWSKKVVKKTQNTGQK